MGEGASFFAQAPFFHCVALNVEFLHNCILAKMMQAWWDGSEVKSHQISLCGTISKQFPPRH